jgi:GYF domain 2
MKMFINKNGQQHGPFDEEKVLEMLRNGQFSPNDFGIKDGQQSWQKLGEIFSEPKQNTSIPPINQPPQNVPNIQVNQQFTPTPQKSGSSKGLMFGLIGCGSLILLSVVGLVAFFALSKNNSNDSAANKSSNSNTATVAPIPTDFTSMKDKAEELAAFSAPLKLDKNAKLKGKVAIVEKGKYAAEIKGFDAYYKAINQTDISSYGITQETLAFKPEEIDTLVQTICTKGKVIGRYEGGIIGYANNCKVSIIDYRNKVTVAQKTFTNSKPEKSVSSVYDSSKEYIVITPFVEIQNYVKTFCACGVTSTTASVVDLPIVEDTKIFANSAEKFAKLNFPVKTQNDAKIKGKVAIIDKSSISTPYLTGLKSDGTISEPLPNSIILTKEGLGFADNQLALKSSEIDTLIQVNCKRGALITKVKGVSVFSNICEVNIVDYKGVATVFQKTFEGKKYDAATYSDPTMYDDKTDEVSFPRDEIYEFIKQFPKG